MTTPTGSSSTGTSSTGNTPRTAGELATTYRPAEVEPAVLERWLETRAYHAEPGPPQTHGEPYSIVIPPPNVTAALHLGHALNNTLQDVLIRYKRMLGRNAMWMPGTDHAGIATQTIVDKRLQAEGQPALKDYKQREAKGEPGREQFIEKVQAWKDEYEAFITNQLKRMGCSCDWDRQRFTMDEVCTRAVREAFFRLFKDGLIYRGKRLVNWDPVTQTALADDEVEMQEVDGNFYYMKYPIVEAFSGSGEAARDTGEFVTVATTRPETMLGDTAVAINPRDPRAARLRGRFVRLPIVNRIIPIVEDDYVVMADPESSDAKAQYASGFLKVTPAHDPNDYEIGQRQKLPIINVMAPDASISLDHGWAALEAHQRDNEDLKPIVGLSREEARKAVLRWFKENDLLAEVRPYRHSVGHSYRSHAAVEPYLSDQWYVSVRTEPGRLQTGENAPGTELPANSLAGLALRAMAEDQRRTPEQVGPYTGRIVDNTIDRRPGVGEKPWEGHLRFYPDRYAKNFQQWHENIRDWCISRQLWWGHRIPVWTKEALPDHDPAFDILYENDGRKGTHPSGAEIYGQRLRAEYADAVIHQVKEWKLADDGSLAGGKHFVCVAPGNEVLERKLEDIGFTRDPDVLDTWFSSALWPLSTMGWPEDTPELATWNPTNTLCTAREIITLWVSRMVMFNLYLSDPDLDPSSTHQRLPFHDVFIHAMIQDGHGQKMSKSLGNGVDPMDIIHSHGSDAMRYTLAAMTTQTQDLRMPVDLVCPHTGQSFEPKFITTPAGHKVAAPIQHCPTDPAKKMVSSYGVASGQVQPTDSGGEMPLARNTSNKFDLGRNFANKLWNAVRFALTSLEEAPPEAPEKPTDAQRSEASVGSVGSESLTLPDRWILSRLARTVHASDEALRNYEFANYAQGLYDFFWRDLCDWYIEAIKPTVRQSPLQQRVLATCIDASLRLLHPVMPFITERLWSQLNEVAPARGMESVALPASEQLILACWPRVERSLVDEDAERRFELVRQVVSAARQTRTQHTIPPRQKVDVTAKAPPAIAQQLLEQQGLIEVLANIAVREIGPRIDKPADAAVAMLAGGGDVELYLHGVVDTATEKTRLDKRAAELGRQIENLQKRLSNESYVSRAPAHLVDETRDQLAAAEREVEAVHEQLKALQA